MENTETLIDKFDDYRDAKPWLDMIQEAENAFEEWNNCCDNVDRTYANLKRLRSDIKDREFQMFWANMEVLFPSIYAREPNPVVTTRFKDRDALKRTTGEVLERCLIANSHAKSQHEDFLSARNDLARTSRGQVWVRYEVEDDREYACIDHLNRRDFLHEPARKWKEVGWVARRAFMTLEEGLERFGEPWRKAAFSETENDTSDDYKFDKKAPVWELWHRVLGVVVWVTPDMEEVLDIDEPYLDLEGFFPCPKPAYGTIQPDSLTPVPDYLFYRDQLDEINRLTNRIFALSDALKVRGFYASGAEDLSKALEKALKSTDDGAVMVPVANMAATGVVNLSNSIVWLPIREIAETIVNLVALRRQLIEDVYQITGISDIMRGSTEKDETATAQRLKSQYGSIRIRERQSEMVRLCRDALALVGEIIAEYFQPQSIMMMAQMDLPSVAQIQQAAMQQGQQGDPNTVTIEAVIELLRSERLRPYVLDIETDSTIQPDEDADKQRRTEAVTALGGLLSQSMELLQAAPEAAEFVGEVIQFGMAPFRLGREMEVAIDDLVDKINARGQQAGEQQDDPAQAEAAMKAQEAQAKAQADAQAKQAEFQARLQELTAKTQADAAMAEQKRLDQAQKHEIEMQQREQEHAMKMEILQADLEKARLGLATSEVKAKEVVNDALSLS